MCGVPMVSQHSIPYQTDCPQAQGWPYTEDSDTYWVFTAALIDSYILWYFLYKRQSFLHQYGMPPRAAINLSYSYAPTMHLQLWKVHFCAEATIHNNTVNFPFPLWNFINCPMQKENCGKVTVHNNAAEFPLSVLNFISCPNEKKTTICNTTVAFHFLC